MRKEFLTMMTSTLLDLSLLTTRSRLVKMHVILLAGYPIRFILYFGRL